MSPPPCTCGLGAVDEVVAPEQGFRKLQFGKKFNASWGLEIFLKKSLESFFVKVLSGENFQALLCRCYLMWNPPRWISGRL